MNNLTYGKKAALLILVVLAIVIVLGAYNISCAFGAESNIPKKCFEPEARNSELPRYKVCAKFDIQWYYLPLVHKSGGGVIGEPVCVPASICQPNINH